MAAGRVMNLKVLLPSRVLLDEPADRIVAEAANGSFCLLPRHRDFATALVPGLLEFTSDRDQSAVFLAVDEGLLVKFGSDVFVSTRHAVRGDDLGSLRSIVAQDFVQLDERERAARTALARLEADFARRFLALSEHEHV